MGKKLRAKTKKDKPRPRNKDGTIIKKKKVVKPETHFNKVLKTGKENDLENEMEKLNELNRTNPTKNTRNKQKRRELVLQRRHMKKRLLSKLRRLHQKRKKEINEEDEDDEDNEEKEHKPKQTTKTIEMLREKDETMIDENDQEMKEALENDEYKNYFNNEYTPQILITTSISHTGGIFRFIKELKNFLPNSYFYYRKK
jgi:hypothetical protein